IGAAVGTYGTSKVTGERPAAERKGVLGSPLRQARLREEWERAEKSATVLNSIGPMQRGDTVKIVAETMANQQPAADDSYDEGEYWYDPKYRGYRFKAKDLDHAYVLIYKNQDGTYGKRLLDAVTFNSHFQLNVAAKVPAPRMPEYPVIPDKKDPDIHDPNPFSTSPQETETSEQPLEQSSPDGEAQEVVSSNESPASSSDEASDITIFRTDRWRLNLRGLMCNSLSALHIFARCAGDRIFPNIELHYHPAAYEASFRIDVRMKIRSIAERELSGYFLIQPNRPQIERWQIQNRASLRGAVNDSVSIGQPAKAIQQSTIRNQCSW
ncbi:MAG: hypothetical protein ACRD4B_02400, partial [Acidobacteriota bacterium]